MYSGKPNQDVISKRLLCKNKHFVTTNFFCLLAVGPLASRGPDARAYRAYRLMRSWSLCIPRAELSSLHAAQLSRGIKHRSKVQGTRRGGLRSPSLSPATFFRSVRSASHSRGVGTGRADSAAAGPIILTNKNFYVHIISTLVHVK